MDPISSPPSQSPNRPISYTLSTAPVKSSSALDVIALQSVHILGILIPILFNSLFFLISLALLSLSTSIRVLVMSAYVSAAPVAAKRSPSKWRKRLISFVMPSKSTPAPLAPRVFTVIETDEKITPPPISPPQLPYDIQEIDILRDESESLRSQLQDIRTELESTKQSLSQKDAQIEELQQRLSSAETESASLHLEVERKDAFIANSEERGSQVLDRLEHSLELIESEFVVSRSKLEEIEFLAGAKDAELDAAKDQIASLQVSNSVLQQRVERQDEEASSLTSVFKELENALHREDSLRSTVTSLESLNSQLQASIASYESSLQQSKERSTETFKKLFTDWSSSYRLVRTKAEQLLEKLMDAREVINEKNFEVLHMKGKLQALEEEIEKLKETVRFGDAEVERLEREVNGLREGLQQREMEVEGLREKNAVIVDALADSGASVRSGSALGRRGTIGGRPESPYAQWSDRAVSPIPPAAPEPEVVEKIVSRFLSSSIPVLISLCEDNA
jgi:predicted nuclease with TOPRIM domain